MISKRRPECPLGAPGAANDPLQRDPNMPSRSSAILQSACFPCLHRVAPRSLQSVRGATPILRLTELIGPHRGHHHAHLRHQRYRSCRWAHDPPRSYARRPQALSSWGQHRSKMLAWTAVASRTPERAAFPAKSIKSEAPATEGASL